MAPCFAARRGISAAIAARALLIVGIAGCAPLGTVERPFSGPATITLAEQRARHVVVVEVPSPGWDVDFDRSDRTLEGHDAFITLRRPDPRFLEPQVTVQKRVLTDVPDTESVRVFARVIDHDDLRSRRPYARAASSRQ